MMPQYDDEQGPYRSEYWVMIAPDITSNITAGSDDDIPAGIAHFDTHGLLHLVQCDYAAWGEGLGAIIQEVNSHDALFDNDRAISTNFYAQTNNLVARYDAEYPRVLKHFLAHQFNITILKYQHTEKGSAARNILDEFYNKSH